MILASLPQNFSTLYNMWIGLAAIGFLLGIGLVSLFYMLATLIMNEKMKSWAKLEFFEIIYSGILLAIIMPLAIFFSNAINDVLPQKVSDRCFFLQQFPHYQDLPCHIVLAEDFFASLFNEAEKYAYDIFWTYSKYAFFGNIGLSVDTMESKVGSISFMPFLGCVNIPNKLIEHSFDFTMKAMIVLRFQEIVLHFITFALFPALLTAGLILRTFYFTRKLGGLLMAIAISLYFFYPLFFIFGDMIYIQIAEKNKQAGGSYSALSNIDFSNTNDLLLPKQTKDMTEENLLNKYGIQPDDPDAANKIREKLATDSELQVKMCSPKKEQEVETAVENTQRESKNFLTSILTFPISLCYKDLELYVGEGGTIDMTARLMFFTMFFSFVALMSTVAVIKDLSAIFGGDIEIAGLTHLI